MYITWGNRDKVDYQIRDALRADNVTPTVGLECNICGRRADLEDLKEFAKGAAYVPPDPFPLGTRVVDLRTGRHGEVVEDKILSIAGPHRHRRQIAVIFDGVGGRSFYHTDEDYNAIAAHLVSEVGWDTK